MANMEVMERLEELLASLRGLIALVTIASVKRDTFIVDTNMDMVKLHFKIIS